MPSLCVVPLLLLLSGPPPAPDSCCDWAVGIIERVRAASYSAELRNKEIRVRPMENAGDYMQARFDIPRFLLGRKMHYIVYVNPRMRTSDPPSDSAIEAIVAHELAHVASYARGPRIRLLGLIGLVFTAKRARFERAADREAIRRGYPAGLRQYRQWLYQHIPASRMKDKLRDYLSPEEIDMIVAAGNQNY